jgi:hypothetical protein
MTVVPSHISWPTRLADIASGLQFRTIGRILEGSQYGETNSARQ